MNGFGASYIFGLFPSALTKTCLIYFLRARIIFSSFSFSKLFLLLLSAVLHASVIDKNWEEILLHLPAFDISNKKRRRHEPDSVSSFSCSSFLKGYKSRFI